MQDEIIINLVCTEPIESFACKSADLKIPKLTPEENRNFLKDLYGRLKGPVYGYFEGGTVFFIGRNDLWYTILNYLTENYGVKQPLKKINYVTLDPNNETNRKILQKIIYSVFEDYLQNKGFLTTLGRKIAIPTPYLQSQKDYALIREGNYFESFYYNIRLSFNNRVTIQFDPKIVVLIPYTRYESRDWVIPKCFDSNCQYFKNCPVLPRNSVIFEKKVTKEIEKCRSESTAAALIYDPKKNKRHVVPCNKLFTEPIPGAIPYIRVRGFSLKDPESRNIYTKRFLDLMKTKGSIVLSFEEKKIQFEKEFMKLIYNPEIVTQEFQEYSVIPEVQAIFGDGMLSVSPFDGLKKYGTYSYNKASDRRYIHPTLRVFSIFPSNEEDSVSVMTNRLESGYYHFSGFDESNNPYKTSISFEKFPIDFHDENDYIDKVKARIKNIQVDYPWKQGYLFLFVIPKGAFKFYDEIKDFCLARKMRSQMIKCENLGFGWFPLYNFSLSLYAKAGGTPWIISPSYFNLAECYIGLAFSRKVNNRFGAGKFFVGAADVFNAFGEHISFALHQASVDQQIFGLHVDRSFMKDLLNKAIDRYIDEMEEPPKRVIVHKPGHFIKPEIEGAQESITEKNIEKCYLIHVQHNSRFRAYDESIDYQIRRGTYFKIGLGNIVLFPTGYLESQKKKQKLGTPKAVQLNVKIVKHDAVSREVPNKDLYEICKNYFGFTRLRWNMLGTRLREPLTIYASRKVAEWLKKGYKGLEGIDIRDIL